MSNPIVIFIIVLIVDAAIKSAKEKSKINKENVNDNRTTQSKPVTVNQPKPRAMDELKNILKEEIEKEKQRMSDATKTVVINKKPTKKVEDSNVKKQEVVKKRVLEDFEIPSQPLNKETEKNKDIEESNSLRSDLLRGIIFSEILSEPKSIQNQRNRR